MLQSKTLVKNLTLKVIKYKNKFTNDFQTFSNYRNQCFVCLFVCLFVFFYLIAFK